ncbi:hypothetical protein NA78x_005979 [Anatilimnocola sp. NA78]|uniref:hypothetical protein n=1 Tax=Anatilimnocola sp. NA78 TaxID=3415683 RepID=UPI003CE48F9A
MSLVFRSSISTACLALLVFAGCAPQDQLAHYSVPKPESIETPLIRPANSGGMPPAMGGGGMTRQPPAAAASDLKFAKPEGWTETAGNAFSLKAFEVTDGSDKIDITVSSAGGDLTANMNRWRGQVGLPEASAEELEQAYKPLEVNGQAGKFIEMHAPEGAAQKDSILGAVVVEGDRTWFIKLRGSTKLAERERANFEAFAKSLEW